VPGIFVFNDKKTRAIPLLEQPWPIASLSQAASGGDFIVHFNESTIKLKPATWTNLNSSLPGWVVSLKHDCCGTPVLQERKVPMTCLR